LFVFVARTDWGHRDLKILPDYTILGQDRRMQATQMHHIS